MNKILFDLSVCQPNKESKFHGGGVYGYIVFKELAKYAPDYLVAYYNFTRFIDPSVVEIIKNNNIKVIDSSQTPISKAYDDVNADVMYSPLFNLRHDVLISEGKKCIITVHGLRAIEMLTDKTETSYATSFSAWCKAFLKGTIWGKRVYQRNYQKYGHLFEAGNVSVITVSNHSKYSIKTYYSTVNVDNISVYYSPSTTVDNYKQFMHVSDEKYYLIISANRWLKNASRAIKAMDYLFDTNKEFQGRVKIVGLNKKTAIYKGIKHKERFDILGYQTQEDLEKLYAGAYAFIYPTLNEGFGYPPLEAMKYGVPVISSPFSSIPEICGDSVLYTNPYSIEEIANRILMLEDASVLTEYKEKGLYRYSQVSSRQIQDLNKLCSSILNL